MFSVDVSEGFGAAPRALFEGTYVGGGTAVMGYDYDLAPDRRFVLIKPSAEELRPPGWFAVMNWPQELDRRIPTGR